MSSVSKMRYAASVESRGQRKRRAKKKRLQDKRAFVEMLMSDAASRKRATVDGKLIMEGMDSSLPTVQSSRAATSRPTGGKNNEGNGQERLEKKC